MSRHIGLREEARAGHLLARRIARLFAPPLEPQVVLSGRYTTVVRPR